MASPQSDVYRKYVYGGVLWFTFKVLVAATLAIPLGIFGSWAAGAGLGIILCFTFMFIDIGRDAARDLLSPSLNIHEKIELFLIAVAVSQLRKIRRCADCGEVECRLAGGECGPPSSCTSCGGRWVFSRVEEDEIANLRRVMSEIRQNIKSAPESDAPFDWQFDEHGRTRLERVIKDEVKSRDDSPVNLPTGLPTRQR